MTPIQIFSPQSSLHRSGYVFRVRGTLSPEKLIRIAALLQNATFSSKNDVIFFYLFSEGIKLTNVEVSKAFCIYPGEIALVILRDTLFS